MRAYCEQEDLSDEMNILVVDDEEHIGLYIDILLTGRGYNISRCKDGQKAFELFEEDSRYFDLVITDQNMPRMSGAQLARLILEVRDDIPIVLCTGYGYDNVMELTSDINITNYLAKPIKASVLLDTVDDLLHGDRKDIRIISTG